MNDHIKPVLVGGIAMCLTANPVGNAGGYSYLYVVYESENDE